MPVMTGEQMLEAASPRLPALLQRLARLWCALALPPPRHGAGR